MAHAMTDGGETIWQMVHEDSSKLMATSMKVTGRTTELTVMVTIDTSKGPNTKVNGKTTFKMDKELKNGKMVQYSKAAID